jgi:hypothetical protein
MRVELNALKPCPEAKAGVHYWILHASNWCHTEGMNDAAAGEFIRERMTREPSPPDEIESAIAKVYNEPPGEPYVHASSVPQLDPVRRAAVIARYPRAYRQLAASNPLIFTGAPTETEFVIDRLFPGNPLICCAKEQHSAITRSREEWRDTKLATLQYVVPSPMSARTGINQKHEVSSRCLDNTGPRRFAVIEQDSGTANHQAAVLLDLANAFPLVMVVFSGSASLHGWYCVEAEDESLIDKFYDRACRYGADNATRCRCQLVRMPGGCRQNGVRQPIIYFDPSAVVLHHDPPQEAQVGVSAPGDIAGAAELSFPADLPTDVAVILKGAPPFGKGLLSWIRPAAMQLLRGGRSATEVAHLLHLVTSRYPQLTPAEILSLRGGPF